MVSTFVFLECTVGDLTSSDSWDTSLFTLVTRLHSTSRRYWIPLSGTHQSTLASHKPYHHALVQLVVWVIRDHNFSWWFLTYLELTTCDRIAQETFKKQKNTWGLTTKGYDIYMPPCSLSFMFCCYSYEGCRQSQYLPFSFCRARISTWLFWESSRWIWQVSFIRTDDCVLHFPPLHLCSLIWKKVHLFYANFLI